jgi:hypothetical protein
MRVVALVVLDQGGNIMIDPNMTVEEKIKVDSPDAAMLKNKADSKRRENRQKPR